MSDLVSENTQAPKEGLTQSAQPAPAASEGDEAWAARVSHDTVRRWREGDHVERPTKMRDGTTYCSCGRLWPCVVAVKNLLWRYIDGRTVAADDGQRLNVALGVLQRHTQYGECSWHPGEYHGICSEAAR